MSGPAIVLRDVWKGFNTRRDRPGFKEFLTNLPAFFGRRQSPFWALRGINLQVDRGECLGVIGRNGAGKSTLLSIMLGTIIPTRGTCTVSGKRTPLLNLGSGFHRDMTGRENVLLNGVLLGLTRCEVEDRMEDILAFSELDDFAERPVRTYSSGMYMRLAFSVAVHTDPEVLLIDEILSVGDESFQKKSRQALMRLITGGVATVYVSHGLSSVRELCGRAVWLDGGEVRAEGDSSRVVDSYLRAAGNRSVANSLSVSGTTGKPAG